jgi:hypothetical protein
MVSIYLYVNLLCWWLVVGGQWLVVGGWWLVVGLILNFATSLPRYFATYFSLPRYLFF